jgi:hypothetical protein
VNERESERERERDMEIESESIENVSKQNKTNF